MFFVQLPNFITRFILVLNCRFEKLYLPQTVQPFPNNHQTVHIPLKQCPAEPIIRKMC